MNSQAKKSKFILIRPQCDIRPQCEKIINVFLGVCTLFLLCSCSKVMSEYNLGLENHTSENLTDVALSLIPQGAHPGLIDAPPGHSGWYMDIKHWEPPKTIIVSFNTPDGGRHKLRKDISLPTNFRGDILVLIKKEKKEYYIEIKTGKMRSLAF